jgi:hypothetical protein
MRVRKAQGEGNMLDRVGTKQGNELLDTCEVERFASVNEGIRSSRPFAGTCWDLDK